MEGEVKVNPYICTEHCKTMALPKNNAPQVHHIHDAASWQVVIKVVIKVKK